MRALVDLFKSGLVGSAVIVRESPCVCFVWVSTDRDAVSVVTETLGDRPELPEGNTASS